MKDCISPPDAVPGERKAARSMRLAMWAGILLAPLVCIWVFRSEILYKTADLASNALSLAAVGVLLTLLVIRFFFPRLENRQIILIYAAIVGTVGICAMGMVQFLIITLLTPFYFSTPENRWQEFWDKIPEWAAPRSDEAVRGFFLGNSSLYNDAIWRVWVVPVLAWSLFIAALLVAQYCLAHLLYRRWAREERLTFPIAQFPLMVTSSARDGRSALLIGAGLALAIQTMNALHYMTPAIPGLNVLPTDLRAMLPPSWKGVGELWSSFYPCIIGLSMLVPVNILFSSVAFFSLTKAENFVGSIMALQGGGASGPGFPYAGEQAQGAVLGLALIVLWSARVSLVKSIRNPAERPAWIALVLSSVVLIGFGVALGLRPMVALLFFGLFFLFMLSIGWLRAAVGLVWNPGNDVAWWARALNGGSMPLGEGVGLAYLRWFSFGDFRAHALPAYVDTMRLAEAVQVKRKTLLTVLAAGSLLSIFASLWVALDVYYRSGAATALTNQWRTYQGVLTFNILRSHLDGAPVAGFTEFKAAAFGFLFIVFLHAANGKLLWWPFHPAGFVAAQTGSLEWLWCPMLIALVIKVILLRVGGLRLYRRMLPFFIGLVLGDYTSGVVLAVLSSLFHVRLYIPFPMCW